MFSLEDFAQLERKKNRIGFISFILLFFFISLLFVFLNFKIHQILFLALFVVIYIITYYLLTKKLDNSFIKKNSDVLSYIFLREYTGNNKYDIQSNFTPTEIKNFIDKLNCEEYAKFNKIPTQYFYVKNKNYPILKFEREYLQHYTRKIQWENISWKYAFVNNDGIFEELSLEYFDKENERIVKSKIITNDIKQNPFHVFILFILYDLKYGKRLSLSMKNYKKRFPFKFLGLSNNATSDL